MSYRFHATEKFWDSFYSLNPAQKESARKAWQFFKQDPFSPHLRAHKIRRLSTIMRQTAYAVEIEKDLRVVFYVEGDLVISFNIGTHDIYRQ